MLRRAVDRNPNSPHAWDALLTGLETAAGRDEVAEALARMPQVLAAEPRFARHRGWLEQELGHWHEAARAYEQAWNFEPDNAVGYRLCRTLRLAGQPTWQTGLTAWCLTTATLSSKREVYSIRSTGHSRMAARPTRPRYTLMAGLRERMGRTEEAQAWRRATRGEAGGSLVTTWSFELFHL